MALVILGTVENSQLSKAPWNPIFKNLLLF